MQELFPSVELRYLHAAISFTRNQTHTYVLMNMHYQRSICRMTRHQVTVLQSMHIRITRYFYFLRKRLAVISCYVQFAFSIEVTRARFRFHTLNMEVDMDRRVIILE